MDWLNTFYEENAGNYRIDSHDVLEQDILGRPLKQVIEKNLRTLIASTDAIVQLWMLTHVLQTVLLHLISQITNCSQQGISTLPIIFVDICIDYVFNVCFL